MSRETVRRPSFKLATVDVEDNRVLFWYSSSLKAKKIDNNQYQYRILVDERNGKENSLGIGSYGWCKNVEIETIFVHVTDSFGSTDILDGLRTSWSKIDGIPYTPCSFRPWGLLNFSHNNKAKEYVFKIKNIFLRFTRGFVSVCFYYLKSAFIHRWCGVGYPQERAYGSP